MTRQPQHAGDAGVLRVCLMGNTRPHRILGRLWELRERRDGWLVAWVAWIWLVNYLHLHLHLHGLLVSV